MTNSQYEVSVIIPAYNEETGIEGTLESLVAGNYCEKFEIIVVDDGSTDDSRKILESYAGFVRVIYNEENIGLPKRYLMMRLLLSLIIILLVKLT